MKATKRGCSDSRATPSLSDAHGDRRSTVPSTDVRVAYCSKQIANSIKSNHLGWIGPHKTDLLRCRTNVRSSTGLYAPTTVRSRKLVRDVLRGSLSMCSQRNPTLWIAGCLGSTAVGRAGHGTLRHSGVREQSSPTVDDQRLACSVQFRPHLQETGCKWREATTH